MKEPKFVGKTREAINEFRKSVISKEVGEEYDGPSYLVFVCDFYCRNSSCNVREVTIKVKEYETNINKDLVCPLCRQPLKVHGIREIGKGDAYGPEALADG